MRRKEIDWLRDGAVLMLFLYHTAVVFDYFSKNYVKSAVQGYVASGFILATFFWFMPLLFFLAGASARFSLKKRSGGAFMSERVKRLLIPFLFGLTVIVPPQGYYAKLWHNIPVGDYFSHWGAFFTHVTDLNGYDGNFTPAHLWFILFLFIISAATMPLLKYFDGEKGQQFLSRIKPVLLSPWGFVVALLTLFLMMAIPFIGDKNIFYFALIYIYGSVLYSDDDYIKAICRIKGRLLAAMLAISPFFLWLEYLSYNGNNALWFKALLGLTQTAMMISAVLALTGYGNKYLNRGGKVLAYLNSACFPVYIMHQTVLIAVAYYTLRLNLNIALEGSIIIAATVIITFALYECVKRIPPLRFLFGIKQTVH